MAAAARRLGPRPARGPRACVEELFHRGGPRLVLGNAAACRQELRQLHEGRHRGRLREEALARLAEAQGPFAGAVEHPDEEIHVVELPQRLACGKVPVAMRALDEVAPQRSGAESRKLPGSPDRRMALWPRGSMEPRA